MVGVVLVSFVLLFKLGKLLEEVHTFWFGIKFYCELVMAGYCNIQK